MHIEGLQEFKRKLARLEKKVVNRTVRTALRGGMKVIAKQIQVLAPRDTGALYRSVKVRAGKRRKNIISINIVISGGHDTAMVGVIEYGGRYRAAQPFIRPGFRSTAPAVGRGIIDAIRRDLREAGK